MSLDRRIVSILYHNGIVDVNKVEKFIGENNNYYEVIIDGKVEKLKIPGNTYFNNEDLVKNLTQKLNELGVILNDITELNPETEEEKNLIKEIDDEFNKLESFSKKLKEAEKSTTLLTTTTFTFEEELEKTDVENKKFLDDIKKVKKSEVKKPEVKKPVEVKKSEVKIENTKAVKSKKLDDDIDNFIDIA